MLTTFIFNLKLDKSNRLMNNRFSFIMRKFRLWRLRLFRRCGMMGCVLLILVFITAYNIPGHHQHPLRQVAVPDLPDHSTRSHSYTSHDTFAVHFQAKYRYHRNQSRWQNAESDADGQRVVTSLRLPDDWPQFFQPRSQQLFSLEFPYSHDARRTCIKPVDLLVLVLSAAKNHRERHVIRRTWGSVVTNSTWPGSTQPATWRIGLVFLLGEDMSGDSNPNSVDEESKQHGDVVQWQGLQDTYFNLTMKVLLGLRWAHEFCRHSGQIMKVDDDTFVHLPRLLQRAQFLDTTNAIWGPFFKTSACERTGKFAVSREAYPFDFYPPHVKGNLYVMSGEVAGRLVMLAPYLPYNNIEDVHITGTLARVLALGHQPFTRREFSVEATSPDPCVFEDGIRLGCQMVPPDLALRIWDNFSDGRLCPPNNHWGQF